LSKIPVLNRAGDILYRVHSGGIERMISLGQATYTFDRRAVQLVEIQSQDEPAGRTHTSRGGLLAAIGRSQQYTTANGRGQVNGFKTIYPEDRDVFRAALLDCIVTV
jgi:hypothetical protein